MARRGAHEPQRAALNSDSGSHAFQKKSKTGIKTPKPDLNLIEKRLQDLIGEREKRR